MQTNEIYNMDCFIGLDKLEDKCVDYAFTSPPYNRKRNDKYTLYDDTVVDYEQFLTSVVEKLRRVVKKHIFLNIQTNFYNKKEVYRFIGNHADVIQNIIIWEKANPMPASGLNVTNAFEYIIVIGEEPFKANHTYTKNHVTTPVNSKTTLKEHRAVMNSVLATWMFQSFIPKGSLVIDPFMGCGTTAVTALENGCSYIDFEIVEEYCNIANKRIEESEGRKECLEW